MTSVLELQSVTKTFRQGSESQIEVLRGVDLKVLAKESASIVGASGGGKSTLLSILSGVDRPTSGTVQALGSELTKLSDDEMTIFRGRKFGIVFQQFHLIAHLTALENVMLPLEINGFADPIEKATKVLNEVGLQNRLYHRPAQLSGGETQRVAIARALAIEPEVILADEPSGNLDSVTGQKVMDLLFELAAKHGSTLVLVTHSAELAERCTKRYALENGKLRTL